ncbi:MAG: hypothetical protein J0I09_03940 [Sphingobacteriia bacterium]|nr:hypothetical protein [Sphingobacteriia bacterium]
MTLKKVLKITGLILLILVLTIVGYYLYLTDFGRKGILSTEPRRPKLEIPVTYNIGWWSDQKSLSIDSLSIDIVESKLNLFNSKSLIAYKVSGHLTYKGHWQPQIESVHISERINLDTTLGCDRIIEITPVIKDKSNDNVNGGTDKFEFKNEHTITSNHWGVNRIKFICGLKQQTIELWQRK